MFEASTTEEEEDVGEIPLADLQDLLDRVPLETQTVFACPETNASPLVPSSSPVLNNSYEVKAEELDLEKGGKIWLGFQ